MRSLILPSAMPRAIACVYASARPANDKGPAELFADLNSAFEDFRDRQVSRLDAIEAAVDRGLQSSAIERLGLPGSGPLAADPKYTDAFASYFRKGTDEEQLRAANSEGFRASVQAAMSVGDNSSGGYLAPVEWDRKIQLAQRATSPMRRLATVQTTANGAYSTLWSNDQFGSGWVGETAARPATSNPALAPIVFTSGEVYAMPSATQRLLDDGAINVEEWLRAGVESEFNRQEGIAFISGDGVNKPSGLLTYVTGGANATAHPGGALDVVNSGAASAITSDGLIAFMYGLAAPYRQNATWLMSSATAAAISQLKDGQGNYLWREGLLADQPATLIGRPVEIDESMPAPTAGNLAIAFGDFGRGYLINDRLGTRVLRDPFTNKPFVMFYVTKRVGGGVLDPRAIRLLKIAA